MARAGQDDPFATESGLSFEAMQEERKEFVRNIYTEYKFGCYELKEKQAESCQLLGEFEEAINLDAKKAFQLFDENCSKNQHPRSCYKVGTYMAGGKESTPDFEKLTRSLEISCNAEEKPVAEGCQLLSLIYWNGEKTRAPKSELAERYMKRACELNNSNACWTLSTWYMGPTGKSEVITGKGKKIIKGRLARDVNQALAYGIKACEEFSVYQACANVSRMYKLGDGIPKDLAKAAEYKGKTMDILNSIKEGLGPEALGFTT